MVDVLSAVPSDASVDVRVIVELSDARPAETTHPPHGLSVIDSFANVLAHDAAFQEALLGETAQSVNRGLHDDEAARHLCHAPGDGMFTLSTEWIDQ